MPIIQTHILQVSSEDDQLRLDIYLARHIPGELSRTFVKRLIDSGQVKVNDQPVKAHYKVSLRDHICVQMAQLPRDNRLAAEDIDLQVFYEDEYMMVVNKPAGMLVHPAGNRVSGTLVNALLNHCDKLSDVNTDVRPGIVHRLDEETSGLILIAKDNKTHIRLSRHFEKHKIRKRYLALVEGSVAFDEGVIDAPIDRHPRYHDKKAVAFNDRAKAAKTFYQVVKRWEKATLIRLFPMTGRTHQLRVHMAYLGHPVLGDEKYGRKESFPRLALHAQAIGLFHPETKEYIEFCSRAPDEFLAYS